MFLKRGWHYRRGISSIPLKSTVQIRFASIQRRSNVDIVYTLHDNVEVIFWDENKNRKLRMERDVGFDDVAGEIVRCEVLDILEHRTREKQKIFVVMLNGGVFAGQFIFDNSEDIFLKTIYPSRKLQRRYGKTQDPDPS